MASNLQRHSVMLGYLELTGHQLQILNDQERALPYLSYYVSWGVTRILSFQFSRFSRFSLQKQSFKLS